MTITQGEGIIESIEPSTGASGTPYVKITISGKKLSAWDASGEAAERIGIGKAVKYAFTSTVKNGRTYSNLQSIAAKSTPSAEGGSTRHQALSLAVAFIQASGIIKEGTPALDVVFGVAEQFESYLKAKDNDDDPEPEE